MKSRWAAYGLISLFSAGALLASTAAWAGPAGHMRGSGGGGDWNKGSKARSVRGGGGNGIGSGANLQRIGRAVNDSRGSNTPVLDALRGNRGSDTPVLDALRGNRGSDTPVLDALRNGGRGRSDTPILDGLRDRYNDNRGYSNGYGGHGGYGHHGYHHNDDVADAYRDAAIANAVVNLVGIAVTAATQPRMQTVTYAPAPAPVAVVQPRGYYQTEKILISDGYYEDVRVHVPDGSPHGGHYEIRKRWNPPVYEYRPVWVVE